MVKNDDWIRCSAAQGMIEPFCEDQVRTGAISYGVSSYGYDMRVGDAFKIFNGSGDYVSDPKNPDPSVFTDIKTECCVIPPHSFVLASSLEYFRIPRDILVICFGKSTYARCGVIVNVTPLEPEWEGYLTISISNTSSVPVKVYSNEGIGQLVFLKAEDVCRRSYKDKKGKYQAQKDITLPRI